MLQCLLLVKNMIIQRQNLGFYQKHRVKLLITTQIILMMTMHTMIMPTTIIVIMSMTMTRFILGMTKT